MRNKWTNHYNVSIAERFCGDKESLHQESRRDRISTKKDVILNTWIYLMGCTGTLDITQVSQNIVLKG